MEFERKIDEWGRVIYPPEALFELLYRGVAPNVITVEKNDTVKDYNELCVKRKMPDEQFSAPEPLETSPEIEQERRLADWHISDDYVTMDVRKAVLDLCRRPEERDRVNVEMDLYEARDLLPLLRLMFALVAHFRAEKIVWGCGRGSAVSSYVLFLLGVHKIDSLRYRLAITDFLKD